jgi:hypothetical protein
MIRVLRRKVIIREYDFNKVRDQAIGPVGFVEIGSLYDRAEFIPFTKDSLGQDYLMKLLGDKTKKGLARPDQHPANWLFDMKDYLYSPKYIQYHPEYGDDGFIYVQARKNTPRTRIGWGLFEKDLQCRI